MNTKYLSYRPGLFLLFIAFFALANACEILDESDSKIKTKEIIFDTAPRGCQNFCVIINNQNWSEFLIIRGDTDSLLPDTTMHEFVVPGTSNLDISVDSYAIEDGTSLAGCFSYCNDAICSEEVFNLTPTTWKLKEGFVMMQRSPIEEVQTIRNHNITIVIKDAVFELDNQELLIEELTINDVPVGDPVVHRF